MPLKIIPFTKTGFENLKKELENLTSKRPEAVKALTRAREMGDLSENGLYKAAKFELGQIDRSIRNLKNLIKSASVLAPVNNDTVQIGHKVKISYSDKQKEFLIVGEFEANPAESRISNKSPIGFALMGRRKGDSIDIKTPNGFIKYKILSIEK
ncbi:MAG: hypothetical protein A2171_01440 [Candidatus Levybacteria bacterium RBG_13_35_9]|nr:MAG: hypothetical protein A2171_01440 [Candidatus Levybacteria bacterium RBG_13_35_9]